MHRLLMIILIPLFCLMASCRPTTTNQDFLIVPHNPQMNAAIGRLFLSRNRSRPEVQTLPSGLQYSIIKNGAGPKPTISSVVSLLYQGRYIDGKVFDNGHIQGNPVAVPVSKMIPGWQEAMQKMQPGAIWVLYIPSNLAFGEQGVPKLVGPNQTLIYTIHLLAVRP